MHSPDPKADSHKKKTSLKDKKAQLSLHLYKGSLMVSPKSTNYTSSTGSEIKPANRFEKHSITRSQSKPFLEPQILHEAMTSRYPKYQSATFNLNLEDASGNVNALLSPRYKTKNPITHSGYGPVQEWKSSSKKTSSSHKTTMFTAEEKPRGLAKGKYNDRARPKENDIPEVKCGLRTYTYGAFTESQPRPEKRVLKEVATSPERNKPNPITEGEDKPVKPRVVVPPVSDFIQRLNERKALLPCERVIHSPNRTSRNLQRPVVMKQILEQEPPKLLERRASNMELNRRKSGTIGQFFDHSQQSDSKFQTAAKISEVEYKTIQSHLNTDRTFARVKADPYI